MPFIPGSSIKGVISHFARAQEGFSAAACDFLFGAAADQDQRYPDGFSGKFTFHDAWWVPNKTTKPMVEEIVTSHHMDYYGSEGEHEATDFDNPVPNSQIAVRGGFLFTIEGPTAWLDLAQDMLMKTLMRQGIGPIARHSLTIKSQVIMAACRQIVTVLQVAQIRR